MDREVKAAREHKVVPEEEQVLELGHRVELVVAGEQIALNDLDEFF